MPLGGDVPVEVVLPMVEALSRAFGVTAQLVRVVPTPATISGERSAAAVLMPIATAPALDIEAEQAAVDLRRLTQSWPAESAPETQVLRGDPSQVLGDLIEDTQPDLVVMSTHGRAGLSGVWAASITSRVIARSTRPLLLVRAPESHAAAVRRDRQT